MVHMASYVLSSHDGFGLGHVRRNISIAEAILRRDPAADITVVTGVPNDLPWLKRRDIRVVRVPSMVKNDAGQYVNDTLSFEQAIVRRAEVFLDVIEQRRPDVVIVDRHPYGTGGELRPGLERCRELGIATVLGLRDILDDAPSVWAELASERWHGVEAMYDHTVVYGARHLCDHEAEYGLPMRPLYTGWVLDEPSAPQAAPVDDRLLVIAAGGGADGAQVRRIGVELIRRNQAWRGVMVAGPAAAEATAAFGHQRMHVVGTIESCRALLSRAGASVQMAGYNTTIEALASGIRPMLLPRRAPRREQAIRATRLAALGLADVVDEGADTAELSWLLDQPRRISPATLRMAGIEMDGADRTATLVGNLVGVRTLGNLAVAR
jgi:predicted glycosyltransferase